MKTKLLTLMLLAGSTVFAAPGVFVGFHFGGGYYAPPPPPVPAYAGVAYGPAPGPGYSWVGGYWYPNGPHYAWHAGYWGRPPYAGARWYGPRYYGGRYYAGRWGRR